MIGRSGAMAGVVVWERWRRALLVLGIGVTVFGVLHHVDHVVRGNHSGWPFREEVTPFTFSLLVYALLLPGIYMNLRGRVAAGWWLFTAAVALALVAFVHFLSGEEREAPIRDIFAVYGSPVWGLLALVVLYGLVLSLAALFVTALRAILALRTRV
ncbi:MAG: hypothetical protein ICV58_03490 [Rubrobacteraceae bacterium]|nr:hypothetical protein [Rubrobacteraceae bacterium]